MWWRKESRERKKRRSTHHPPSFSLSPSAGGVVVRTPDGRIRASNTLDARLATAYAARLPEVRAALFGGGA